MYLLSTIANATACICEPAKIRSLWDIIYGCLGTIGICTYVSIHPNIPDPDSSWSQQIIQKFKTAFYALLAPEFVIYWAIRQRVVASRIEKCYKHLGWTKTHGFFVQMGGIMCETDRDSGEYLMLRTEGDRGEWLGQKPFRDVQGLEIPEEEIKDKAKGDPLSKALAVVQTTWFIVQCIARQTQGLVVTELELVTLAFAALNAITYFLWWHKPLNAQCPMYFKWNGQRSTGPSRDRDSGTISEKGLIKRIISDFREYSLVVVLWRWLIKKPFSAIFLPLIEMLLDDEFDEKEKGRKGVGAYYAGKMDMTDKAYLMYASSLIGIFFGGLHLIGWNFSFPTELEQRLWRISSVVITAVPALLALTAIPLDLRTRFFVDEEEWTTHISSLVFTLTAMLSRGWFHRLFSSPYRPPCLSLLLSP
ncbi:hypothetical protein AX16_005767 [Volvariella volvacea WC 439]|nr:hypothetical protein AX16_005767 [Volvariella volvacea WC 439]